MPRPAAIKAKIKLPDLMKDLGFIKGFRGREGYMVLEHPELAIEFLVAEKHRGTDKPVSLPQLGMNAQALRWILMYTGNRILCRSYIPKFQEDNSGRFAMDSLYVKNNRDHNHGYCKDLHP